MSTPDDVWDYAYTQAILMWLTQHGYSPNTIPLNRRKRVMETARGHAMQMADLAIRELFSSRAPDGATLHLALDRDATEVLESLEAFTQLSTGDVLQHSIAVYEWLRQQLHANPAVTITREMCPHLAPKPHLRLV